MSYSYFKQVKVLFESSDGVLKISFSSQKLYVSANDDQLMLVKVFNATSSWESACRPEELLYQVKKLFGSRYTIELQERHEEFLDELISYWEE
jgi:hypothetical protein